MTKWIRLLGALPLLWIVFAHLPAAQAEEFLDPDVAFKFSARALDADQHDPGHGGEQQPQQHPAADGVGNPEDADRFQHRKRQQQ